MRFLTTRLLLLLMTAVPLMVDAQAPATSDRRADVGRARVAELSAAGAAEGQLIERLPGSYVFAPIQRDLPEVVIANPSSVPATALRRPLIVGGRLDSLGRLEIESFRLSLPRLVDATPLRAKAAAAGIRDRASEMIASVSSITAPTAAVAPAPPPSPSAAPLPPSPPPISDDDIRQQVIRLESSYREALAARDLAALKNIARQWIELRAIIVDPYAVNPDTKAIYGELDNYAPWRYDVIFDSRRPSLRWATRVRRQPVAAAC